jgi:hypothetical protein
MAITDLQKTDYLWKKVGFGVAKTDYANAKSASNESIASPLVLRADSIWQQSSSIPSAIPAANTSIITVYNDTANTTVQATNDGTAQTNRTWLTGLTNWIDASFGSTYQVKVYIANTGWYNAQTSGTQVFADGSGNQDEWFFDYSSGVLNFMGNNLPTYANLTPISFSGKSVYVSGARYTGQTGISTFVTPVTFNNVAVHNGNLYANNFQANGNASVTGNLSAGNLSTLGNVTANYHFGNGYTLTGVNLYGNAQVAAYLPVYGGNISAYNLNANLITNNIFSTTYDPNINLDPSYQGIVAVNSNTAVLMPVGNSFNYPTFSIAGMMRWNTDLGYLEVYNGTQWTAVETGAGAGLITSDVFTGNGSQTQFSLSQNNTTQGTLVSINGVIQIPSMSYNVSGNVLTMVEAPLSTDVLEARSVTAITQVAAIKNGNAELLATTTNGSPTIEVLINGLNVFSVDAANTNVYNTLQVSNAIVANVTATTVSSTTLAIDSFRTSLYRTAKYIVSASNTGSGYYQSLEALVTQNGSTANIIVTANGIIGSSIVTLTANVSGGLAKLWATTTTSGNNIKVIPTYIPV